MRHPLALDNVLPHLEATFRDALRSQLTDPEEPGVGAVVRSDDGRPSPWFTASMIVAGAYLRLAGVDLDSSLLDRLLWAADALMALQRPSGLIDLPTVNIDSAPDTGFTVQQLCTVLELGGDMAAADGHWAELLDKLGRFIRRAAAGMREGGFHTPNHRWVIASALTQAQALFPDLDVESTIDAYLAEGIDVDAEGFYIERSVGTYDAVNNRSWLLLADHRELSSALDAVRRNLALDLHLLHADDTAETRLSRRQDYGRREVPSNLIPCYLLYHRLRPTSTFTEAARWLWTQAETPGNLLWTCYALLKGGDPAAAPDAALPTDFALHLPSNGIWRLRRGPLSVSAFRDATRLLSFGYGEAMLSGLRIDQTYFGGDCGHFVSDAMGVQGGQVVLRSEGCGRPRRPGYEQPLGRPVPPERWDETMAKRELRRLPPATATLTLEEVAGGLSLHYWNVEGLEGIAVQVILDFEPGGIWETADTRLRPRPGQVLFLKEGWGEMRYGTDVIRVEGGAYAHSMWQMRESAPPGDAVRVLLTFETPVDHTFRLIGTSTPDAVRCAGEREL
ncbi:MAG: hypothetical protein ACP5HG_13350 [Anaerolineae bacterium]